MSRLFALGCNLLLVTGLLPSPVGLSPAFSQAVRPPPEDHRFPFTIEIRGNEAMIDEVYLSLLDIGPEDQLSEETAAKARDVILGFLLSAGYDYADVRIRIDIPKNSMFILIDEGRIEKILFEGQGTFAVLQMNTYFEAGERVFNRFYVERRIREIEKEYGKSGMTYELVYNDTWDHKGIQVGDWLAVIRVPGGALDEPIHPRHYNLILRAPKSDWSAGFGFELGYFSSDGASLNAHYQNKSLFLEGDRWRLDASAGAKLRTDIESGDRYLAVTEGTFKAHYYTPELLSGVRSHLALSSTLNSFQRKDLDIEIYYTEVLDASLSVEYETTSRSRFSVGGGWQTKYLFGVSQLEDPPAVVERATRHRPFAAAEAALVFGNPEERADRLHRLDLSVRHYFGSEESYSEFGFSYTKVFEFGWHDLWLRGHGTALTGDVLVGDEERIGGHYVRGLFDDSFYVCNVLSTSLEFRYSLTRDYVKISVFNDVAIFDDQAHIADGFSVRWANAFGLGVNLLLLDAFQLDIYYALGLADNMTFDNGLVTSFLKVF